MPADAAAHRGRPGTARSQTRARARPTDGRTLYATTCVTCHGEDGQGGTHGGIALTSALNVGAIVNVVKNGRNEMPPYGALMSQQNLQNLASYLLDDLLGE
jgi:mono/diheme cytochrome c family protein